MCEMKISFPATSGETGVTFTRVTPVLVNKLLGLFKECILSICVFMAIIEREWEGGREGRSKGGRGGREASTLERGPPRCFYFGV